MTNFYNAGKAESESMMIVRRSHSHAVNVFIRRSAEGRGVIVTRVEQSQGQPPDLVGITGAVFHSPKAIRAAVLHRMRKINDNHDDGDIHDD